MVQTTPHIYICLATFNGAQFLEEQLESFVAQTHENWSLIVSDDGSLDSTIEILEKFQTDNPERDILILDGPQKGYAENFLSLLRRIPSVPEYVAFSDQDDVWKPKKLERALGKLSLFSDRASLYCGSCILINELGIPKTPSSLHKRPPSFENALVQNIAAGNTIVFNRQAFDVINQKQQRSSIVSHDWWAYLAVTAVGGHVVYDKVPYVLYRQHSLNLIGANNSFKAWVSRFLALLAGRYSRWNTANIILLETLPEITPDNQHLLHSFKELKTLKGVAAIQLFCRSKLYRQTRFQTVFLAIMCFLGKV